MAFRRLQGQAWPCTTQRPREDGAEDEADQGDEAAPCPLVTVDCAEAAEKKRRPLHVRATVAGRAGNATRTQ